MRYKYGNSLVVNLLVVLKLTSVVIITVGMLIKAATYADPQLQSKSVKTRNGL